MKVHELIEHLLKLDGDKEIMFHNGLDCNDYNILPTITEHTMTKLSFDAYCKASREQAGRLNKPAEDVTTMAIYYGNNHKWQRKVLNHSTYCKKGSFIEKSVYFLESTLDT